MPRPEPATSWNPAADGGVDALAVSGSAPSTPAGGLLVHRRAGACTRRRFLGRHDRERDGMEPRREQQPSTHWRCPGPPRPCTPDGYFASIGGQPRGLLAALDAATGNATAWNPMMQAGFESSVEAIVPTGSTVFAGGFFSAAGRADPRESRGARRCDGDRNCLGSGHDGRWCGVRAGDDGIDGVRRRLLRIVGVGSDHGVHEALDPRAAVDPSGEPDAIDGTDPRGLVLALAASPTAVYAGGSFAFAEGRVTGPFAVLCRRG